MRVRITVATVSKNSEEYQDIELDAQSIVDAVKRANVIYGAKFRPGIDFVQFTLEKL